jgi:hypothetical protein
MRRTGQSRWRTSSVRIVTALIVLVVASAFAVEVKSSVAETNKLVSSNYIARQNLQYAYFQCLSHQVKSLVPPRKRVWVNLHTPNGTDRTTLKKVVAPYAPIAFRSGGLVKLTLVGTHGTTTGCLGMRVRAQSPDGAIRYGTGSLVGSAHDLPPDRR